MFSRLLALLVKELLAALKDPRARTALIGPPIIQTLLFSFAITMEPKNLTLAVYDADGGKWSHELVERFRAAQIFTDVFAVENEEQTTGALDDQLAVAVLVIPRDFSRAIERGAAEGWSGPAARAEVQLLLDGRKTNTVQIVAGYASQIVNTLQLELVNAGADRGADGAGGSGAGGIALIERNWFNPNLDYKWYTVPSLVAVLSTLIALLVTAMSVAREREAGTFEQLLVSPLRPGEILAGKASAALLIAEIEASLILLVGVFVLAIPFQGSVWLLYGSMTVFLLSIVGVGLFISSLCMTQQQAIMGTFTFMVPAIILSGFATPIENMPAWLQSVTPANPMRWFLVIVRGIFLKDMSAAEVAHNTWPMAIIALVTLSAAAILFRKRME